MITLIENGEVYGPQPLGQASVLLVDGTIQKVGDVDAHVIERLGLLFEVVDATGCFVTPGLIDPHQHLLGGSGEEGFSSQTPEISTRDIVSAGITTVVGCLGVDTTMKTMAGLLARAKALKEEGLSAFIWSGGYNVPPTTIMSSVGDDVMFIEEVIGAGEIAISDHRSTNPTAHELARVVNDAYIGGMLSKKAGVSHFHVGDTPERLKLLRQLIDDYHTPPHCIYPTHVERNEELMREAIELTRRGCFVDLDTAGEDLTKSIRFYFDNDGDPGHLTLSSDAGQTGPTKLLDQIRTCAKQRSLEFSALISLVTKNTATVLKLADKGVLAPGKAADVLVMDSETLQLKEVIARGKRLLKNGRLEKLSGKN
ncbi:MAG TPA: amidohydrolase family protein [Pyrinomonadaceae bacterium]|nr:amidohydrolase family protein [Pyrinomonadaceae bacterium]